ncbi:hypothetical protein H8S22_02280 [Anaerostipes sp. NSJ-7]|uniref:Uncharacterized protein n=3 Tax=Anaerostipes TaxID=207244 RepID=A0ABV4DG62_9FIRM|nr:MULTISPECIES: hypothetical protein [Anaerostipes]MBC5676481.1 hypothetical protein [Anaerostipes hominis (ex Liu et al. 2021)]
MSDLVRKYNNALAVIVSVLAVFGMFGIHQIRIFGMVVTPYRIFIPILFVLCFTFTWRYNNHGLNHQHIIKIVASIFIVWLLYGSLQLLIIDNLNLKEGIKELFGLALGFAMVFIVIYCIINEANCSIFINTIKFIYVLLLGLACLEIITRYHLYTSRLANELSDNIFSTIDSSKKIATTIFYNENDYAAFIAIFVPVFFVFNTKKEMIFNTIIIAVSIGFLRMFDSWTAIFAVGVSCIVFFFNYLLEKKKSVLQLIYRVIILSTYFWSHKVLNAIFSFLRSILTGFGGEHDVEIADLQSTIKAQLIDRTGTSGSIRINSYIDSFVDTFKDTFGLGYGPGGYAKHLQEGEKGLLLSNPHCLWSEILTQYGIIIFLVYVMFLMYIFISLLKIYAKEHDKIILTLILVDISYIFAVFGPSGFLNYGYSWLVIGINVGSVIISKINKGM